MTAYSVCTVFQELIPFERSILWTSSFSIIITSQQIVNFISLIMVFVCQRLYLTLYDVMYRAYTKMAVQHNSDEMLNGS